MNVETKIKNLEHERDNLIWELSDMVNLKPFSRWLAYNRSLREQVADTKRKMFEIDNVKTTYQMAKEELSTPPAKP